MRKFIVSIYFNSFAKEKEKDLQLDCESATIAAEWLEFILNNMKPYKHTNIHTYIYIAMY